MKTTAKLLGAFLLGLVMVTSFYACSKDDDPANNNLFVGTYKGSVSYKDGSSEKQNDNGSVTVSKVGDLYKFSFSDDIPNISGIRIEKNDNTYVGISDDGIVNITIDQSTLKLTVTRGSQYWTADCTR